MLDTSLRALRANGIFEVYIVVGYLKDQFKTLEHEYPSVKLIENPYYDCCNNISSLYVARDYLKSDTMILDGDLIINNRNILAPAFECSGYSCVWSNERINEWFLYVNEDGIVNECRIGGGYSWQMYGVSRWTEEDGIKLKHDLEVEFEEKKNRRIFWDEIPLFYHKDNYKITVNKIRSEDIIEIDTYEELKAIDDTYK